MNLLAAFHDLPLLRAVFEFCELKFAVSREQFYGGLVGFVNENPGSLLAAVTDAVHRMPERVTDFEAELTREQWAFVKCSANVDRFFSELRTYVGQWVKDETLLGDLLDYQKARFADVEQTADVAFIGLHWNFHEYLAGREPFTEEKTVYLITRRAWNTDIVAYSRSVVNGDSFENTLDRRDKGWRAFFPRGNGPLISVLMPTRGRPGHLLEAVDSMWSLAIDKSIEFVFRADDDDEETLKVLKLLEDVVPCKMLIGPRGGGYHDMHHMVNEMSAAAEGDWLFLANDDCRMQTVGWDLVVALVGTSKPWPGIYDVCLLMFRTVNRPFANEFPLLRRKTFEILGHFSKSQHNDTWIHTVCHSVLGVCLYTPVFVRHLSDTIGDKTRQESEAAYATTIHTLTSFEGKRNRIADMIRLLDYMEGLDGAYGR